MKGKDIQKGTVIGNKRVFEVIERGRFVLYSYEYKVAIDDSSRLYKTGRDWEWFKQSIPPVERVHCNKIIADE